LAGPKNRLYNSDYFSNLFSDSQPFRPAKAPLILKETAMTAPILPEAFTSAPQLTDTTPLHDAARLTRGGNLARILLNGQVYSLRITRAGKLILTK
jgi:hemin uptake protein HemP